MIPSYEQVGDWLEEISAGFPDVFLTSWTGASSWGGGPPGPGVPTGEMYIMGEYCHDLLGRYIVLYYGSFAALLAEEDEETWKDELFTTVAHEFTHHMEETAGLHALDDKDAEFLRQARRSMAARSERSAALVLHKEAAVPLERQPSCKEFPHLQTMALLTGGFLIDLWKGSVSASSRLTCQTGPEAGVPPGLAVVGHHAGHRLIVPHHDEQALGPGDGGIQHPPGHQHGGPVQGGQDHRPVLAALGLVYRDGEGGLQLPQHIRGVLHQLAVKVHQDDLLVHRADHPDVPVEHPHAGGGPPSSRQRMS